MRSSTIGVIGGWLLVLAVALALWQPISFVSVASAALPSLGFRGWPASVELLIAGLVAASNVAAAWSLWTRAPHAVSWSRLALVLGAARGVQSLYWTRLPSDVVPGTETVHAALIAVYTGGWLLYLSRSARAAALT